MNKVNKDNGYYLPIDNRGRVTGETPVPFSYCSDKQETKRGRHYLGKGYLILNGIIQEEIKHFWK